MDKQMTGRESLFYLGGILKSCVQWEDRKQKEALKARNRTGALKAAGRLEAYQNILNDVEELKAHCKTDY